MIPVQLIFRNGVSCLFGSAQNLYFDDREIAECMCIPFFRHTGYSAGVSGMTKRDMQSNNDKQQERDQ